MSEMNWESLRDLHDQVATTAADEFGKNGVLAPSVLILEVDVDGRPIDKAPLPDSVLGMFFGSTDGKNAFAAFLQEMLSDGSETRESFIRGVGFTPNLIIQVNEVWALRASNVAEAKGRTKSIAEEPERIEAIGILLHTPQGSISSMHVILNKPTRHCVVAAFPNKEQIAMQMANQIGRMNVHPRPREGRAH